MTRETAPRFSLSLAILDTRIPRLSGERISLYTILEYINPVRERKARVVGGTRARLRLSTRKETLVDARVWGWYRYRRRFTITRAYRLCARLVFEQSGCFFGESSWEISAFEDSSSSCKRELRGENSKRQ